MEHPEEEQDFPRCNDPIESKRKKVKSLEMFIGKKTENFNNLLEVLAIEVDSAFLEAEYYLTAPNTGEIYEYKKGACSIAFDFYVDPTAQIETCAVEVSFPREKEFEITNVIEKLLNDSVYVVKKIYDGALNDLNKRLSRR